MRTPATEGESRVVRDLRWGVGWGVTLAAVYSILVVVLFVAAGPGPFVARRVTLLSTVAVYAFGGVCSGALVGVLRPLTRWRVGAAATGVVACLPLSVGFLTVMYGNPSYWPWSAAPGGLLAALLVGSMAGYRTWEPPAA